MQYGIAISPFYVLLEAVEIRDARANRTNRSKVCLSGEWRDFRKREKKCRRVQPSIRETRLVMREIFRAAMLR